MVNDDFYLVHDLFPVGTRVTGHPKHFGVNTIKGTIKEIITGNDFPLGVKWDGMGSIYHYSKDQLIRVDE